MLGQPEGFCTWHLSRIAGLKSQVQAALEKVGRNFTALLQKTANWLVRGEHERRVPPPLTEEILDIASGAEFPCGCRPDKSLEEIVQAVVRDTSVNQYGGNEAMAPALSK